MQAEQKLEKNCENCKYFSQHYNIQGIRIKKVACGHCIHEKVRKTRKKLDDFCELWEDITITNAEHKNLARSSIEIIAERLKQIAMILENDAEE